MGVRSLAQLAATMSPLPFPYGGMLPRRFPVQRLCSEQIYVNFLILSMDETLLWLNGVNYIGFSLGMDMWENICLSSAALLQ